MEDIYRVEQDGRKLIIKGIYGDAIYCGVDKDAAIAHYLENDEIEETSDTTENMRQAMLY